MSSGDRMRCWLSLQTRPERKHRFVVNSGWDMETLIENAEKRLKVSVAEVHDNRGAVIDTVEDIFPDDELVAVPKEHAEVAAHDDRAGVQQDHRSSSDPRVLRRGATFSGRPADLAILPGADTGKPSGGGGAAATGAGNPSERGVEDDERGAEARAKLPSDMDKAVTVMRAVTKLQALARTRSARKLYGQLLFDKYLQEEEELKEKERRDVEEGMQLIERHQSERDMVDRELLERTLRHERHLHDPASPIDL